MQLKNGSHCLTVASPPPPGPSGRAENPPSKPAFLLSLSANQRHRSRTLWAQARGLEREGPGTKGGGSVPEASPMRLKLVRVTGHLEGFMSPEKGRGTTEPVALWGGGDQQPQGAPFAVRADRLPGRGHGGSGGRYEGPFSLRPPSPLCTCSPLGRRHCYWPGVGGWRHTRSPSVPRSPSLRGDTSPRAAHRCPLARRCLLRGRLERNERLNVPAL